jgi:16S rRNA (adenine1518-N6/adenine1519-N6)-dimethyltransferase
MTFRANTSQGQHWLCDQGVLDQFVGAINPKPGDFFLEIGPGLGVLTEPILRLGATVVAVEKDRRCLARLRDLSLRYSGLFTYHCGDILAQPFDVYCGDFSGPIRLVGNLPYCISSPIIFHMMDILDRLQDAHFMLQKEVVDRLAAVPGSKAWGRLSVMVQRSLRVEALASIPKEAFDPPPKVMSSTVRLLPRDETLSVVDDELFLRLVRAAFQQRRKILKNSLSSFFEEADWDALPICGKGRPERCSVKDFIALTEAAFLKNQRNEED